MLALPKPLFRLPSRPALWLPSAILAAGLALAQPAQAMPTYTLSATGGAFGSPNWSQSATVILNGQSRRVGAGLFRLSADDGISGSFDLLTFCVEIAQSLSLPNTYQEAPFLARVAASVNALWANAFGLVVGGQSAAAFQLALWDLTHDTDFSLTAGDLQVQADAGTMALAQSWLDNINLSLWAADPDLLVSRLASAGSQDQLFVQRRGPDPVAVSLPATGLLLLGAVAALLAHRHRRPA